MNLVSCGILRIRQSIQRPRRTRTWLANDCPASAVETVSVQFLADSEL
jgi:hypothetical protein